MPPGRCLAPLLFCLGTRPIQAANWRAEWNWVGSVTVAKPEVCAVATIAEAVIGPMPGMVASRWLALLPLCQAMIAASTFFTRSPNVSSSAANPPSASQASAGTLAVSSPMGTATRSATRAMP